MVVVNHHLFFADVVLRDEGVSELLPIVQHGDLRRGAPAAGHRDACSSARQVAAGQLVELARDARMGLRAAARDVAPTCRMRAPDARQGGARAAPGVSGDGWALSRDAGAGAARVRGRRSTGSPTALDRAAQRRSSQCGAQRGTRTGCAQRAGGGSARSRAGATAASDAEAGGTQGGRWIDVTRQVAAAGVRRFRSRRTVPRQVEGARGRGSSPRRRCRSGGTSRTSRDQLGLAEAATRAWAEPLRLREAGAAVRAARPARRSQHAGYTRSGGRGGAAGCSRRAAAALSCSSPRCARCAHARERRDALARARLDYPLLGAGRRLAHASCSCAFPRARQRGAARQPTSFWEGVDVRGEALSLVVIDKLPFAPPDDPVLAARIDALRAEGGNPFIELQLPQAMLRSSRVPAG